MRAASRRCCRAAPARSCCGGTEPGGALNRQVKRFSMYGKFEQHLARELDGIREAGFYKSERVITSPQGTHVEVASGQDVINLCANNYLGLAQDERVRRAAQEGL